jgi:hypothetical protein
MNNNKRISLLILAIVISTAAFSQPVNWRSLKKDNKHMIHASAGLEYGVNFGLGYNYQLRSKFPILLGVEYSLPSGNDLADDFKAKIGGQMRFAIVNDFHFSARIQGIFRKYNNPMAVRLLNFGSDFAATIGYYKPKWFVATEAGFDKAIVTHFKHNKEYKQMYPSVMDGWYEPSTGGNFNYGVQAGYSFRNSEVTVKGGKLLSQDFKTAPSLPIYLKVGYSIYFN